MKKYMNEKKIPEADKYYSPTSIIREGFLGDWMKSKKTFVDMLRTERAIEVFKPIIKVGPKNTQYYIKGQTLLDILADIEAGTLRL